jgi:hypothetical protein
MALCVEMSVERKLLGSRGVVGDHGLRLPCGDELTKSVGIVGGIGDDGLGRQSG